MTESTKTLRQLVENALSDEELIDLCQDEFPKIFNQFTAGQTKPQRIRFLVEYAERQRETSKLLSEIERINPGVYAEFIDNTQNTTPEPQKAPKVFISYSYDSEEQMDRVLALSDRLRRDGVDCNIDRYEQSPAQGWQRWMMEEIEKADFVLMICTPQYIRRFRGNEEDGMGMGVTWEGSIITQELYTQAGKNLKYIPILFAPRDADSIPTILRNTSKYTLDEQKGYELLYRRLTNQPYPPKPGLGKLRTLSAREREQFFAASLEKTTIQEKEPCNLPRKSYVNFVGRKEEIIELLRRISPEYRQHINVVRGIGGVGKTALVLEVAYKCWTAKKNGIIIQGIPVFEAIIFTSSKATDLVNTHMINRPEKEPLLTDIFRVISDVLNEPTITQVKQKEQFKKVQEVLSKQSTLLIVDNMETLSEKDRNVILSFLNDVPKSTQVIITTRDFLGFDSILINSLTRSESFDLLTRQASTKDITITSKWKRLVYDRFGGIPIALIYAVGKRAAGYQFTDITDTTVTLTEDLGKFCFENSVVHIKGTTAYKLLIAMTFFLNAPCRHALISVAGLTGENQSVMDGLAKLQQLSLITEEKERYNILSITREYALSELEAITNADFKRLARERWYAWYLEFTQQYGGLDWDSWRAKYDRLDTEWENIESVLNWYAEKAEWTKVLQLWENVDNYADLSGYWQDRRYWWALLGKHVGSTKIQVKALSEKGFTLTLMGTEYYQEAEQYLNKAWDLSKDVDKLVQSTVANHQSVLAKVKEDYDRAHYWLNLEENSLKEYQSQPDTDKEKKRYQIRNLYYRAETNYLENKIGLAQDGFDRVIELSREIDWQRFRNYAKNYLVEIHLRQGDLESAETILKIGISSAYRAKETRRIALYHASYARLYYQLAQRVAQGDLMEKSETFCIDNAKKYANRAMKVFSKEFMIAEKNELTKLIGLINEY
jgi:SEFIR domain/Effector-associated domain 7/NB-ARC domain